MIRYSGLKINIEHTDEDIKKALLKKLRIRDLKLVNYSVVKRSLDARDKKYLHWNYIIDFTTSNDKEIMKSVRYRPELSIPSSNIYRLPMSGSILYDQLSQGKICIIGAGPAGLFAAYFLAENGFQPILIEQGEAVEDRLETVKAFWNNEKGLDPFSNIQFGEGGAGTFSDGKLNTGVNDPSGRNMLVLSTFVKNGAPENILYDSKPHIGTDILINVIKNMRSHIVENGGEIMFNTRFTEANYKKCGNAPASCGYMLESIIAEDTRTSIRKTIPCSNLILAIGHSSRETFNYIINETPLKVDAKPFAVGIRVQHLQDDINKAQYGAENTVKYADKLPPADYKLVWHSPEGETVYSFCMCPGGYVVNSSSEPGRLCINGMSYSDRGGENANSAIVLAVKPSEDPLENIRFQQDLEEKAFLCADGRIPVQKFSDFENGKVSENFGKIKPCFKGDYTLADLNMILDDHISGPLKEALHYFGTKIKGYDDPDVLLSAVESRTSSPVRIQRNEKLEADIAGIYPCGEGAGYAGGITSAAIDGIKVFEEIYKKYYISRF